jgi:hypothetical protein
MNESRIMKQFTAVFSVLMVFFYLGVGIYFIFYAGNITLPQPVKVIFGGTFILYGVYRAFRAYNALAEAFFKKPDDEEDNYEEEEEDDGRYRISRNVRKRK